MCTWKLLLNTKASPCKVLYKCNKRLTQLQRVADENLLDMLRLHSYCNLYFNIFGFRHFLSSTSYFYSPTEFTSGTITAQNDPLCLTPLTLHLLWRKSGGGVSYLALTTIHKCCKQHIFFHTLQKWTLEYTLTPKAYQKKLNN